MWHRAWRYRRRVPAASPCLVSKSFIPPSPTGEGVLQKYFLPHSLCKRAIYISIAHYCYVIRMYQHVNVPFSCLRQLVSLALVIVVFIGLAAKGGGIADCHG
ncbi:hypothetical protein KIF59_14710 [Enterobacter cloacae subsp. cloacae]|nr:hypothetical protein [Enterobacter cloacae subsp. cloacae]